MKITIGCAGWNGSPQMYYSTYDEDYLENLARKIEVSQLPVWCIFDNTASGAAVGNGLWMKSRTQ